MALKRASASFEKALRTAKAPKLAQIELAEALWKAERQKPGSLKDIATETGMSLRKAYYLFELWDKFADLKVNRDLLVDVGWTKLAIVAKHLQPGMELAFLDLAQRNTAKELPAILLGGSQDLDKARSVQLRLTPTQYKTFEAVLRKFGAKSAKNGHGLVNKEKAIMRIVNKMQAAGQ
jgi:hypothetical protein